MAGWEEACVSRFAVRVSKLVNRDVPYWYRDCYNYTARTKCMVTGEFFMHNLLQLNLHLLKGKIVKLLWCVDKGAFSVWFTAKGT